MQRGESNGNVMTKQTVNGNVLESGREAPKRERECERATKGHPTAREAATTTNSGGVLLGLILGINHTLALTHIPAHELWAFDCTFCYSPISFN